MKQSESWGKSRNFLGIFEPVNTNLWTKNIITMRNMARKHEMKQPQRTKITIKTIKHSKIHIPNPP
jgi:hypothetical protein